MWNISEYLVLSISTATATIYYSLPQLIYIQYILYGADRSFNM